MNQQRLDYPAIKTLTLSSLGGALEFYDFIVFLTFADILQTLFFPANNPLLSTVMTYATYAVAYFVRPLSGVIIAHFGDRLGRKKMFMFSLFLMAVPTLAIGLLPTYAEIGFVAPLLLLLCRLLQGVALGGEVPSAHVFVTEHVPPNRIGIANSMVASGLTFGVLIGHFVAYLINTFFSESEILRYAWRLPFILGGLLGLFAVYLRRHLNETPVFLKMREKQHISAEIPIKRVLRDYRHETLLAILSTWLLITGVVMVVLAPNLMRSEFHLNAQFVSKIAIIATIMNVIGSIIAGAIADRVGIRKTLTFYAIGLALTASLFFYALTTQGNITIATLYGISALFLGIVACVPIIIIQLFPAQIRLSGIGFSYNIGNALFAGLTTFSIPILAKHFNPLFIAYYILFLCGLAIVIALLLGRNKNITHSQ